MKIFRFYKEKHGLPLAMDLGVIEETPHFFFSPEVHCADFFEIMLFLRGNGHIFIETQEIELRNGTFLFISPFQKRSWQVERESIKGYFLIFEKEFLNEFFSDHLFVYRLHYFYNSSQKPYFIPNTRIFKFEKDIFKEILNEFTHYRPDSKHLLRSILYYLLIKMNRHFCEFHHLPQDIHTNNLAFSFKEALEEHFRTLQQVNEYAGLLNTSRISLNAAVKHQFGNTASQMIKDRLLLEIKSKLLYTTHNISEIAYQLNFSEPNNMIRFFKAKTGLTPNMYRKANQ